MLWKFLDPPNMAVIVDRRIFKNRDWIARVTHDFDDGGWQFHVKYSKPLEESDAMIVGLQEVARIDESIFELADLPLGWCAWRESEKSPWQRAKIAKIDTP